MSSKDPNLPLQKLSITGKGGQQTPKCNTPTGRKVSIDKPNDIDQDLPLHLHQKKLLKAEFENGADLRRRCTYPHPKGYVVDYTKLEADLMKEVAADKLYWVRNAAKLRAVAQPGTYEEFRQIVLGAHLKPLMKEEAEALKSDSVKGKVVWNTLAEKSAAEKNGLPKTRDVLDKATLELEVRKCTREFCNTWKKCRDLEEKVEFLKCFYKTKFTTNYTYMEKAFADEVPPEIIPYILEALLAIVDKKSEDDPELVLGTLRIISESKRFNLTRDFFTRDEIEDLKVIFERLESKLTKEPEIKETDTANKGNFQEPKPVNLFNTVKIRYNLI